MSCNVYASMLKMHDTFRPASEPIVLACDMAAPELTVLREQYGSAEWMEQWLANVKAATFRYVSPEDVRKAPRVGKA